MPLAPREGPLDTEVAVLSHPKVLDHQVEEVRERPLILLLQAADEPRVVLVP